MNTFSIHPGPVIPSVSPGSSCAPVATIRTSYPSTEPSVRWTSSSSMLHGIDVALVEDDAVVKLLVAGLDDLVRVGEAERHEQEPRLVDVAVVLVDHRDRHLLVAVPAAEAVRDQRAAGPRTQDHDSIGHDIPRPLPHRRYDVDCSLGDAATAVALYDPYSNGILRPVRRSATSLRHAHETPPGRVRIAIECRPGKTTSREFTGMISGYSSTASPILPTRCCSSRATHSSNVSASRKSFVTERSPPGRGESLRASPRTLAALRRERTVERGPESFRPRPAR